jgi:hypothetical protein
LPSELSLQSSIHNINMPNVAQKPNDVLEAKAVEAWGAVVDGRGRNVVFKHKQLIRLFGESGFYPL